MSSNQYQPLAQKQETAAAASNNAAVVFRHLGQVAYEKTYQEMLSVVSQPVNVIKTLPDTFWFLEHEPVFTRGIRAHHDDECTEIGGIPLINTDRGGLITYHGPGQLTIYALCHLNSKNVRRFVTFLEQVVIDILQHYGITANRRDGMPGVYVKLDKIASIGLRVKNGMSYHGISLNVDMDMQPFLLIDPCGYQGLKMTQIRDFRADTDMKDVIQTAKQVITQLHQPIL